METTEDYMRRALGLFAVDPPDSEYQRGYLAALQVFASEAMGIDPALEPPPRPKFTVIEGGRTP